MRLYCVPFPELSVREVFPMVAHWFYSLAACALCAGVAPGQLRQVEGPTTPPDGKLVPNKVPDRSDFRALTGPGEGTRVRSAQPLLPLAAPQENPRVGYNQPALTPQIFERNLTAPTQPRPGPSAFRVQPGDKATRITDTLPQRSLAPNAVERVTEPQGRMQKRFHTENPPAERIRGR
jgi:hypothetical protein